MKTTTRPQQRPGAGISITLLAATGLIVGAAAFTAHLGPGQHAVRMRPAAAYTWDSPGPATGTASPVTTSPSSSSISGDAGAAQASAPATWCPTSDPTKPVCSQTGAFQNDIQDDYNTVKPDTTPFGLGDNGNDSPDGTIMQEGRTIDTAMIAAGWPHAHDFFQHYLDGNWLLQ